MVALLLLLSALASPETERMLLGPSPFLRNEGMERAVREQDWGLLARAAGSTAWDARRLAALGLGPRTPPELLKDPVASVREAALLGLDLLAPEQMVLPLLLDEDDAVRTAAAWALRGRGDGAALRALHGDATPMVAATALAASGQFARLRTLAAARELDVALPALLLLGRGGDSADARYLFARLEKAIKEAGSKRAPLIYFRPDPNPEAAISRAVGELARRGVGFAGKPIADHLRRLAAAAPASSKGSDVLLLAEAVAGARDAESARLLLDRIVRLMKGSTLPSAYWEPAVHGVLHALAREPWPELAPLLVPLLEEREESIRLAAVSALAGAAARVALRDRSPLVRAAACAQVGSLEDLTGALADKDPGVVAAAARAIGREGGAGAAKALLALLDHPREEARLAAVGGLLRVESAKRPPRLYRVAIEDGSAGVRAAATAVLAFIEDDASLGAAVGDLLHEDLRVRERALAFLHARTPVRHGYDAKAPGPGAGLWAEWWKGRSSRETPQDAFRNHVEDLRRRGLDLVLVLDATSSMARVIQATKRRIVSVVDRLRTVVPDLRVRLVAFRDEGDLFVTLGSPHTHDTRLLEDFLAGVGAEGGGDAPEAVFAGLREALSGTPWRRKAHRVVLLFGDAPPHERDMTLLQAILGEFPGVLHAVDAGGYALGLSGTGNEAAFRAIAAWGRGTFQRLAGEWDLLRELLVLTLGPDHRAAIEALLGL